LGNPKLFSPDVHSFQRRSTQLVSSFRVPTLEADSFLSTPDYRTWKMLKLRPYIPLPFVIVGLVIAVWMSSREVNVFSASEMLRSGEIKQAGKFVLEEQKRYMLNVRSSPNLGANLSYGPLTVALLDPEEETVFEIEDYYWSQSGVWREGGESGTWNESNERTDLWFVAPASGTYALELRYDQDAKVSGRRVERIGVWLGIDRKPYQNTALWVVSLILLLFVPYLIWSRKRLFLEKFSTLAPGSSLSIRSGDETVDLTIRDVYCGHDASQTYHDYELSYVCEVGSDLRTVSVESFEWYVENSEGDDVEKNADVVFLSIPLSERETDVLMECDPVASITFRGQPFARYRRGRSCVNHLRAEGQERQYNEEYALYFPDDDSVGFGSAYDAPKQEPGTLALLRTWVSVGDSNHAEVASLEYIQSRMKLAEAANEDIEWSLMKIVRWQDIDVIRSIEREET
jgi:hypothetical protein